MMSKNKVIDIKETTLPNDSIRSPETPKKFVATFVLEKSVFWATGGGQWRKMANNGEKWRIMAMANSAFSFVKFAIFRQFLILEFHI